MLICWLIGHRYDYEMIKPVLALVCTRCGSMRLLYETTAEEGTIIKLKVTPSPHCTSSAPPRSSPDRP
jgi:hypothetical protein